MASKINGVEGNPPTSVATGSATRGAQTTPSAASSGVASSDSVHITDTAGQLAALEQTVSQMPAVDEARVGAVQSAIDQGRYTVSAANVADRLMQFEHSLSSLQGKKSPR